MTTLQILGCVYGGSIAVVLIDLCLFKGYLSGKVARVWYWYDDKVK